MVSFRTIAAGLAALSVPAICQTTPAQIVTGINELAQKSAALQPTAQSIDTVNGPLVLAGQGPFPEIIRGFQDIINTGNAQVQAFSSGADVAAGIQADAIRNAYSDFARTHQHLLATLIGKAGLFQTVPFVGQPIAQILRLDEDFIDRYTFSLADKIPSRGEDIESVGRPLSQTAGIAVQQYDGALQKKMKRDVKVMVA